MTEKENDDYALKQKNRFPTSIDPDRMRVAYNKGNFNGEWFLVYWDGTDYVNSCGWCFRMDYVRDCGMQCFHIQELQLAMKDLYWAAMTERMGGCGGCYLDRFNTKEELLAELRKRVVAEPVVARFNLVRPIFRLFNYLRG
jgi:hypothetical protein